MKLKRSEVEIGLFGEIIKKSPKFRVESKFFELKFHHSFGFEKMMLDG